MKYTETEFGRSLPRLQLGQVTKANDDGTWELQYRVMVGEEVIQEALCQTINIADLNEIDVDEKGFTSNAKLCGQGANKDKFLRIPSNGSGKDYSHLGPQ